jgi:D-alanyl-lipoteichoic acid acyltransferase DltB (MBOAT superfamily)
MQFNSIPFLLFFSILYLLYWNIPRRFREVLLLFGGAFFYGFSSLHFLFHFVIVTFINYLFYNWIRKSTGKTAITIALISNVLNLAFFKYFYFFCNFLFHITGSTLFTDLSSSVKITLPLAISFYTFQAIALLVDTYRNRIQISEPIGMFRFLLFFLFFPVLIAGPIMRTTDFFPNLQKLEPDREQFYRGSYLLLSGLVKKVLIADSCALLVSPVFANPSENDSISLFLGAFGFLIQLYFDFSGLTDLARGVALYLGFEIPENFKAPFFSKSLSEFWTRWHITLSTWLKEYIYFSLGGSRVSESRVYFNLILTMTLGGFWHGSDYTFIAWGAYWGIFLAIERFMGDKLGFSLGQGFLANIYRPILVTFVGMVSLFMFRSNTAKDMMDLFVGLVVNTPHMLQDKIISCGGSWIIGGMEIIGSEPFLLSRMKNLDSLLVYGFLLCLFHWFQYSPEKLQRFRKYDPYLLIILGVITVFLLTTMAQDSNAFIYYTF